MIRSRIEQVQAWEALDSRGRPTVAARVRLTGGATGTTRVPSGASAGSHEARELRDGGDRYQGYGVRTAVAGVIEALEPAVRGLDANDQATVDAAIEQAAADAGPDRVGANSTLAVSIATALAAADQEGVDLACRLAGDGPLLLPMPMINIVSGGAHAGSAIDLQDFLVVPHGAASFAEAIAWAQAVRQRAVEVARRRGFEEAVLVADEGGLGLRLESNEAAIGLVIEAIEAAGLTPGEQASVAIDAAATEFYAEGAYRLAAEDRVLTAEELITEYAGWLDRYPIVSIEDPLAEDDWAGWQTITARLGGHCDLIGDDLFVTQRDRLDRGIAERSANAILIKVNQNGLLSRTQDVITAAQRAGFRTVVSARSGETEDAWVADLAVGWRAGQIKVGSTHRSERTAKWNRLLEFEATADTEWAGWP
ncbi:phosphopyruvate hydratase [Microlunatus parietis]|uniref:Enolase n=1 Tax=Microlunatus parietis TaxID=682979 RepID=A0A7Y9LCL3_9ACTN|nr:phosphopyruvate hydratase [Microlunatus parietis]NYE71805.1 enolase [Microlunatus parietis]